MAQFDIVIPVGPNDASVIQQQLEYTKKNIVGYRNIYIVVPRALYESLRSLSGCQLICEDIFPFSLDMMSSVANAPSNTGRNGWYLQQLIKLYAGFIIPDILDKWLIIDSDTFFLKPTSFIDTDKCLYAYGTEYHPPYFEHMNRLIPGLKKVDPHKSGICHHMIFEKKYVSEIFTIVEQAHAKSFWQAFLECINPAGFYGSGASEYELYFNYMLTHNTQQIIIRQLSWKNSQTLDVHAANDYISWHHYARR
jgi:hypothetical protein